MMAAVRLGVAAILLAVASGGCLRVAPVNPNLLAPKVVFDADRDGKAQVYVHSAFGDRRYDEIAVEVNNATRRVVEGAYSVEERLGVADAFVRVSARYAENSFGFGSRITLDEDGERVMVSVAAAGGTWEPPRSFNVPFERILERDEGSG